MPRIIKREYYETFERNLSRFLKRMGVEEFTEGDKTHRTWVAHTKGGPLTIRIPNTNWAMDMYGTSVYSIHARFHDPAKAKEIHFLHWASLDRLNPHSGKWNFHRFSMETILKEFKSELLAIL